MSKKKTNEEFVKEANLIHDNKYDYSISKYKSAHVDLYIICEEHGIFTKTPNEHCSKRQGCQKCSNCYSPTTEEFIKICKVVHVDLYNYLLVEYKNANTKIKVICEKDNHGIFYPTAHSHKFGSGCPVCQNSKGEMKIMDFLIENNIKYIQQYKFNDCIYKQHLLFDFYLPDYNVCIEYDGEFHFEPRYNDINNVEFDKTKIRDNIKNEYCDNNHIKLIRIPYYDFNDIDIILSKYLTINQFVSVSSN